MHAFFSNPQTRLKNLLIKLLTLGVLGIIVFYNIGWLLSALPYGPFYEPDNYMYYKYAMQMASGTAPLNTQLIGYPPLPFFERPGLYQVPALLSIITRIPLIYSFRLIILLLIALNLFLIYKFVHYFYQTMLLPKHLEYFGLMLAFAFPLLFYQFEPIEWRGNLFVATLALAMAWLFLKQRTAQHRIQKLPYLAIACILLPLAWYFWNGWFIILPFFLLLFAFTYAPDLIRARRRALYASALITLAAILIFIFHAQLSVAIGAVSGQLTGFSGCTNNPLDLAEVQCFSPSNGLSLVAVSIIIFAFAFAGVWKYSIEKRSTNFYLYLLLAASISFLLPALIYVRLVTLVAPFFAIAFAIGYSAMQYSSGAELFNKLLQITVAAAVMVGLFYFIFAYYDSAYAQYLLDNPQFLPAVANVLSAQNGTVNLFTFFAYGDWFEANTKANVYADTVQGLNTTRIELMDTILLSNASTACPMLQHDLPVQPNYILVSRMFKSYTLLQNATNDSIILDPNSLERCGYVPVLTQENATLLERAK